MSSLNERLLQLQLRIGQACESVGRDPRDVTLVGVSKTVDRQAIDAAYRAGLRDFGENRIQDASAKLVEHWPTDARRHLIGSLQTNKAATAVKIFDLIHTVDRQSLIDELRKQGGRQEKQIEVLLQVNIAREPQKSGCDPDDALQLVSAMTEIPELNLRGLMTIAPLVDSPEEARPVFAGLRALQEELQHSVGEALPNLSMGMTNDFDVAIQEGATHVRIGRALFESSS